MTSYPIPTVVESTSRGERVSDIFSRLLSERIVFLGTPINDGVANVVIAQLLHLSADAPQDISIYINSPGGSVSASLAIYDTIQFIPNDVATLCVGQAASTAATLLASGTAGKRAMLPHARALLAQPHTEGSRGSISDLALEAAEMAEIRREAETLLAFHVGRTPEQVRQDTDRVQVLRAGQAVDYGLVDQVLTVSGSEQRGIEAVAR